MLESESNSLLERVADLERRLLAQRDEIVCLRATLADALRRIDQLECKNQRKNPESRESGGKRATMLLKNGNNQQTNISSFKDLKVRHSGGGLSSHEMQYGSLSHSVTQQRPLDSTTSSNLPQRRYLHHQSTSSLHSDSHSSNSVSPIPSPSPRATPLPSSRSVTPKFIRQPQSDLRKAKRWSSTGDFSIHSLTTKGNNTQLTSSSTREVLYNEEDGEVGTHLRYRPMSICVPSNALGNYDSHKVNAPPQNKLKLDWVYGYRGRDCRNNLHLLPTGEVVYFVASVVVLYNTEEHNQRHYLGHTNDVKCIAIHPNKLVMATGQASSAQNKNTAAHIRIWNSVSLLTICTISNRLDESICCLSFSKADGGDLLAAVDESPDHNISIWDWQKGKSGCRITETKCSVDTVVCAEWHPIEQNQIVSCGKGHVSFWSLDTSGMLYKRIGLFESREKPKYVTCVAFSQNGDILTGDSNGNVIVWSRGTNTITRLIKHLHEGSIFSVCVLKSGNIVTGGGKDGKIILFDGSLNPVGMEVQIEDHFGGIRTIAEGRGGQLLVGTTKNCILLGNLDIGFHPTMLGHAEEVWGLAAHPILPQFATAGHDRLLQMWDSLSHSVVWSKDIGEQAQSVCFSPDGTVMVVGCVSGKWLAIDSETREIYSYHSDGSEALQVIKYSPDGALLAIGSRDNSIYIYQVNGDATKYNRVGRCMGHSSSISHLDWSLHGHYIRSNGSNFELLYWNAGVCRQVMQGSILKDVEWATHSCIISFETIGVWPDGMDNVDVSNCNRSGDGKLLATGDISGNVKLFTYPACQPKSLCHSYGGHSNHVTNVVFLQDDVRLISSGGSDTSVLQWMVAN